MKEWPVKIQIKWGCDHRSSCHKLSNCKLSLTKHFRTSTDFGPLACITAAVQSYGDPYIRPDQFISSCERKWKIAGVAQWWECSPPINVSRVRFSLLLALYSAPRSFSPGTPVFPSPQKPTFPNSNSILECTDVSERILVNFLAFRW